MFEIECHIQERVAYYAALTLHSDDPTYLQYEYLQRQFAVAFSALRFTRSTLGQSSGLAYDDRLLDHIAVFKCCLDALGGRDAAMYSLQLQHAMPRKTPAVERHLEQLMALYDRLSLDYRALRTTSHRDERHLRLGELEALRAALNAIYVTVEQANAGVIIQRIHELDQTIGRWWDDRALHEI
jgi:hypothetical protein